ncbi:hypothetical protein SO694_00005313 [Aureococcus anophagefferens]|uniref:Uncharacterized protein n=1 Tax=Aureococcus anophagefferens TaxID=44056 RepID=A0ABR1G995_AURAN
MAMNQRVQKILLELMRERHSLYAGFTDVELKSILKSHAGDRERIERRVPLTREGVDSLDWNEACEYAKSMGVSKKSHRDARRVHAAACGRGSTAASARSSSPRGRPTRRASAGSARGADGPPARPTAARAARGPAPRQRR